MDNIYSDGFDKLPSAESRPNKIIRAIGNRSQPVDQVSGHGMLGEGSELVRLTVTAIIK